MALTHNYKGGIQWTNPPDFPANGNANYVSVYGDDTGNDGQDPDNPAETVNAIMDWTLSPETAHSINMAAGVYNQTIHEIPDFGSLPDIRGFAEIFGDHKNEVFFEGQGAEAFFTNTDQVIRANVVNITADGYDNYTIAPAEEVRVRTSVFRNMIITYADIANPSGAGVNRLLRDSVFINCTIINGRDYGSGSDDRVFDKCIFIGCNVETSLATNCFFDPTSYLTIRGQTDESIRTVNFNNIQCALTVNVGGSSVSYGTVEEQIAGDDRFNQDSINVEPEFVAPFLGAFQLKPNSGMIGAGRDGENITGREIASGIMSTSEPVTEGTAENLTFGENGFWLVEPGRIAGTLETAIIDLGAIIVLGVVNTIGQVNYNAHTNDSDNVGENQFRPNPLNYLARWGDTEIALEAADFRSFIFSEPMKFDQGGLTPGDQGYLWTGAVDITARYIQVKIIIRDDYTPELDTHSIDNSAMISAIPAKRAAETFPAIDFSDPGLTDKPFSLSWWNKVNFTNSKLADGWDGTITTKGIELGSGLITFYDDSGIGNKVSRAFTASPGVWHHILVTYDGSRTIGGFKCYRNGVDVGAFTEGGTWNKISNFSHFSIPAIDVIPAEGMTGLTKDLLFTDNVLTIDDAIELYNGGVFRRADRLDSIKKNAVFYMSFDENLRDDATGKELIVDNPPAIFDEEIPN